MSEDDINQPSTSSIGGNSNLNLSNISEYLASFIEEELLPTPPPPTLLVLHRGKVFEELLSAFKHHSDLNNIQVEMILPNGQKEIAEDMGGVMRDALTEIWQVFYEKCTVGTNLKVPCLRDDFGFAEWEAIAKIIGIGWSDHNYFPIHLAPVFIKNCIDQLVTDDEIVNDFLKFISESESSTLEKALTNFDSVEEEELVDFFSNFKSKRLVAKFNFKSVLVGVAQKELLQKPEFVAKCFSKSGALGKIGDPISLYSLCLPTSKNIMAKLRLKDENLSSAEETMFGYLKKFIRETDQRTRSAFLRFCTGSDIVNQHIEVTFNKSSGFVRLPIAHTCTCLLELPCTYESFVNFRSEFNNILNSNVWIMDII